MLRSRDVELAFLGLIPQPITATQLLYRTTDMNGKPEATVTTVIVPAERHSRAALPAAVLPVRDRRHVLALLSVLRAAARAKAIGSLAQLELLLIAAAVAEGWAVSVPDHEGRDGLWGAPYEPGYRILDGIRAALNSDRLGLSPSAPIGLWGYSGGGLASAWAAEMCARLRARAGHRRGRAGLTRRRPGPHLPPAQRQLPGRFARAWWSPRSPTSTPTWTG